MLRYLKLTLALFRYSLSRELMFKANFLLWIIVEFVWFGIQLTLIEVIYGHVNEVAGWNKYQMYVLISTSHIVQQLFQFVFMINCMELPDNVRTGKLDFALLQPANSQFLVSIRKFDLGALVNGTSALAIVCYALMKLDANVDFQQIIMYAALIGNGVLIHYSLMLALVTISFWIVRAQGLVYGYYNLFQVARIPRDAFKGGVKIFFTFCLPMLVVANFPAAVLAHGLADWRNLWVFGLAAFFLSIVSFWFRFALRFYTSASS
jgi:ABC-2 type transport system permease protein